MYIIRYEDEDGDWQYLDKAPTDLVEAVRHYQNSKWGRKVQLLECKVLHTERVRYGD